MISKLIAFSGLAALCCAGQAGVTLKQSGKKLTVNNQYYQVEFDGSKGYAMTGLKASGKQAYVQGELIFSTDGEQEKYIGRYCTAPRKFMQQRAKVNCSVLNNSSQKAEFKLEWKFPGGSAKDVVSCVAGSPLIKHDVELSFNQIMFEAYYQLDGRNFSSSRGESIFYPDKKRIKGVWYNGFSSFCPTWKFAWNPNKKIGFGIIGPSGQGWASIHYMMRGRKEGWNWDLTRMQLIRKPLRYIKLPGKVNFTFYVIAGGNPQIADKLAIALLPKPKDISIDKVWPQKLITRNGKDNYTTITVTNNGSKAGKVELVSKAIWDVNKDKVIDTRTLTLQPGGTSTFEVNWKGNPMDWGMTFRTDAYVDGKLVDSKEEYCAVSNFAPAVAGVSIYNAGNCKQEGSEATWAERLRKGYIGVVEFYCWQSSTINGLAPKVDKWEPHTESQGAYRTVMTKKFLKTFIDDAHKNGVYVYAMITGLFNFRNGLENPEVFQYCKNGQPNLYNGKVYGGEKRFSVGKANAFNEKFAYKWGQEMGRSVDMFGWDGCRWDWAFIPNAPCDPLYQDKMKGKELPDWYDNKGVPSKNLYPDSDAVAAKALKAWRKGVEESHPEFVYGSNGHATAEAFRLTPKHSKARATKSLLLFEYLLNYSGKSLNTWQKWAKELTLDCQRVRPYGAQPMVGFMRGLLPGTVSLNLAQYICFASGVKWWEGPAVPDGIDRSYIRHRFMVRFSEYYFDNAFRLLPEKRRMKEVKLDGNPRIFWQQFVYERSKNGFRDVTVHLINLPQSDYICQRHEVPPVRKNVKISVQAVGREKLSAAYAMLPNPKPHAIKLNVSGNTAVLPELTDAAIILFKFKK
jgi:hypothetical protein